MRLWARLALLMSLVSVIPLLLTSYRAVEVATSKAEATSRRVLEGDARRMAATLQTWAEGQGTALSGWMLLYPELADQGPERQAALLRAVFVAMPSVVAVMLIDPDGVPVTGVEPVYLEQASASGPLRGRPTIDEEGLNRFMGKIPVSEAHLAGAEGLERFGTASGYVVGRGWTQDVGYASAAAATGPRDADLILGAQLDLSVVLERLAVSLDPERSMAVLEADGSVLFASERARLNADTLRPLLGMQASFTEGGTRTRGAVAPVPGTGWSIVVMEPAAAAARTADAIRVRTTQVLAVAIVLAILMGLVMSRYFTEPVAELRDQALALADGDYERRVRVSSSDELGELALAFNHMAAQLAKSLHEIRAQQGEIEAFNVELQQRVDDRTAELKSAQAQLVESGQLAAVAEVGAGLAHELNNPLTGILGMVQIMRSKDPDNTQLKRVEQQAERCREVVSAMLRFSAGDVDRRGVPVVDLSDLLREVLGLVRGPFRQRGVELRFADPATPLNVRIDPVLGSRILAQILNSLRSGLHNGDQLDVSATGVDGEVILDFVPSRPVAVGKARDDFMTSGMALWVARRVLDQVQGRLVEPKEGEAGPWRIVLPDASRFTGTPPMGTPSLGGPA